MVDAGVDAAGVATGVGELGLAVVAATAIPDGAPGAATGAPPPARRADPARAGWKSAGGRRCVAEGRPYTYQVPAGDQTRTVVVVPREDGRYDVTIDGTSHTLLAGESAWNLPDYLFTSGPCSGQVRWGFTYWSSPYPLSTAFTTMPPFNPRKGGAAVLSRFRSDHVGDVVNFTFVDGSCRYLSATISQQVLDSLGTRAGGEPVGEY